MIAKLMVSHQSREEAIVRMKRALNEFIIEGIETTIPFHIKIMDDENFKKVISQQISWILLNIRCPVIKSYSIIF